jgi:hypothetical protein
LNRTGQHPDAPLPQCSRYWIAAELPRVGCLGALCRNGEDSYARMKPEWF